MLLTRFILKYDIKEAYQIPQRRIFGQSKEIITTVLHHEDSINYKKAREFKLRMSVIRLKNYVLL